MRSKKVRAALTGFVLLSATLAGTLAHNIHSDFFIDPETGQPKVVIVVGNKAAAEDIVSAAMLAAKVSNRYTEDASDTALPLISQAVHENIPFFTDVDIFNDRVLSDLDHLEFPTVDVPDARVYRDWEHNNTSITYRLLLWYFDDCSHGFWGNNDGYFQPWETHEEIQIRFDNCNTETTSVLESAPCLCGGDILYRNGSRLPWFQIPGLIYRADNIFVPPVVKGRTAYIPIEEIHESIDLKTVFVPDPVMVTQEMLPQFSLFNTTYTVVDAGPVLDVNRTTGEPGSLHGTPYLITGAPHLETKIYLHKDESVQFSDYTVELLEVNIDHEKALFRVYQNGTLLDTFWLYSDRWICGFTPYPLPPGACRRLGLSPLVQREISFPPKDPLFSPYETWKDLNINNELDPGEFTNIITYDFNKDGVPDYRKWVVYETTKDVWAYSVWQKYTDDQNNSWLLFDTVDFAVDYARPFIGANGAVGTEIIVYWLENKKLWYNHLCCNPWVTEPDYQLFLDVYESGWDHISETYVYQPPGTGLWPPAGLNRWIETVGNNTFVGNGFLDTNDGHIGHEYSLVPPGYFPENNDLDRDQETTNDCRKSDWTLSEACTSYFDIEDPAVWHGPGLTMVELNISLCDRICASTQNAWTILGPHLKELPYFTIEVADVHIEEGINYTTEITTIQIDRMTLADVDETGLVIYDAEFDFTGWKSTCDCNVVLIGGPVVNSIVAQLVDEGVSLIDWTASSGQWEHIKAPYGGCDILIVAGKDRECTNKAVVDLINQL